MNLGLMGFGYGRMGTFGSGSASPTLNLSGTQTLAENAGIATSVGTLSVTNGTGTYSFSITADPDNKFTTVGADLRTDQLLNYEADTSHPVTVLADNGAGSTVSREFTITVTNVLETVLAALSLSAATLPEGSAENTVVGNVLGATGGSTVTMTDTASSRFKLSGTQVQAGSVATDFETATSHNITLRETHADGSNSPRDTVIAITVTDVLDTLGVLTLSADEIQSGAAEDTVVGALGNLFPGSSLTMTDTASNHFKLSGTNVVAGSNDTDIDVADEHDITVRETFGGLSNSPRDTVFTINVVEAGAATYRLILQGVVASTGAREMVTLGGIVSEE